jgi:TetR/AcrR family transcriptional regulator, cholesterol catabolism regulator
VTTAVKPETGRKVEGRESRQPGEDQISRVACRIFRERGYHATSMRVIASALGWQPAALYYYYPGKEDLLFSIMETAVDTLTRYVREHVDLNAPPADRLRQAIAAHTTLIADHLDELSVFLHEMKALSPKKREIIQAKTARYEHIFRDILNDGITSGEFADVDPRLARYLVLSACNWIYNWYRPEGSYRPDVIASAFSDMIINGIWGGRARTGDQSTSR